MSVEQPITMRKIFVRSLISTGATALAALGLYITLGVTPFSAVLFAVACVAAAVLASIIA